jgi:hypothetical protein
MDEILAKAIGDWIDTSRGGRQLKNLHISVIGIHSLEQVDSEVARRLARSFLISRSIHWSSCEDKRDWKGKSSTASRKITGV